MPYVQVRITREEINTPARKAALIRGITDLLADVLGKDPATTFVVVDEVALEDWGVGGRPVEEFRRQTARASPEPDRSPRDPR